MSEPSEFEIQVSPPAPSRSASPLPTSVPSPAPKLDTEGVATSFPPSFGTGALLSGRAATVATILGTILGFAAGFLPEPYGLVLAVASMLASGFVGAVAEVPRFVHGRRLVSAAVAPSLFGIGLFLGQHATTLPEGWLKAVLAAVSVACVAASGRPVAPGGVSARRL